MPTLLQASSHNHRRRTTIPAILATAAGITFTLASAAVNVRYALGKADDPTMQAVWVAVAVAASVALALAPSAFISALSARRYGGAILALVASLIFGAYSVTAALGSATGGRLVASAEADDVAVRRKAAARDIGVYTLEAAAISTIRSVPEIEAEIRSVLAATKGLDDCTPRPNWFPVDRHREACKTIAALNVEKAGAGRKAALADDIREARAILAETKAGKAVANSDAVALQGFASAAGLTVEVETLNRLLVVLAVLVIELGGGLAFAVAGSLGTNHGTPAIIETAAVVSRVPGVDQSQTPVDAGPVPEVSQARVPACPRQDGSPEATVLEVLKGKGGAVVASQRSMAQLFGMSRSTVNRTLHDLAASGIVRLATTTKGTVVTLAAAH